MAVLTELEDSRTLIERHLADLRRLEYAAIEIAQDDDLTPETADRLGQLALDIGVARAVPEALACRDEFRRPLPVKKETAK
jgi:hypothetical protein